MKYRMIMRPLMNPKRISAIVIGALATATARRVRPAAGHHERMVIADRMIHALVVVRAAL
jgi:hypothetical protein